MDEREELIAKEACIKAAGELFQGTGDTAGFIRAARLAIALITGAKAEPPKLVSRAPGPGGATDTPAVPPSPPPPAPPPPAPAPEAPKPPPRVCPKCNSKLWDNRPRKASGLYSPRAPDFKCSNPRCQEPIWLDRR